MTSLVPFPFPLIINPLVPRSQHNDRNQPDSHKSNLQPVPKQVFRRIIRPVEITRHSARQITRTDVNRHSRRTLIAASEIVGHPSDVPGERGVNSAGCDEDACVDEAGKSTDGGSRDGDDEAD